MRDAAAARTSPVGEHGIDVHGRRSRMWDSRANDRLAGLYPDRGAVRQLLTILENSDWP
jgi:hypothetical protein